MRTRIVFCIAAIGLLAASAATRAAPITQIYEGEASGFVDSSRPGLISPYSTVQFAFTVTFDPLVSSGLGATAVDDYSGTLALPDFGPWVFQYDATTKRMTIGDHCLETSPGECDFTVSAVDAIFNLDLTDPDNPIFLSMVLRVMGSYPDPQGGSDSGTFRPSIRTINGDNGINVPEPGTLALLGLGLTGLALSRKRKAA